MLWDWVGWIFWGLILCVTSYGVTRAASLAHFRTKLEYMRELMTEATKETENGPSQGGQS
jgi:hypothetical protein